MLFDADGVLQTARDGWLAQLTAAGGERGEEFVLAVFAAESECVTGADFGAVMAGLLAEFQITKPLSEVIPNDYWIQPDRAMLDAVRKLRDHGLRCALATNQQNLRGTYMRTSLGLEMIFDRQFYSCELAVAKPDPRYFELIMESTGAKAERVLFVDDNASNVAAARSVGLIAELFPRNGGVAALKMIMSQHGVQL